jgi:hypothetical protein
VPRISILAAGLGLAVVLLPACDREAEPLLCTEVAAGGLVITEIRGGALTDTDGQWIELYNAGGAPVELQGLAVDLETLGGDVDRVLLRRAHAVAPGDRAVIGKFADDAPPAHVDVGWGTTGAIASRGAVSIACGARIDRVPYGVNPEPQPPLPDPLPSGLPLPDASAHEDTNPPSQPPSPRRGTYALGLDPPDAVGNDAFDAWCVDSTETLGPCSGNRCLEYYQGSPGEPNPACPP